MVRVLCVRGVVIAYCNILRFGLVHARAFFLTGIARTRPVFESFSYCSLIVCHLQPNAGSRAAVALVGALTAAAVMQPIPFHN